MYDVTIWINRRNKWTGIIKWTVWKGSVQKQKKHKFQEYDELDHLMHIVKYSIKNILNKRI